MADISHELRTPLSVLQAQLEAMQDGIEPLDADSLAHLSGEVHILARLVEDMRQITLSEVGAFDYRREPIDLAALLQKEVQRWREPLAQAGMRLNLAAPAALPVAGDSVRLRQLLRNLFNNALRHAADHRRRTPPAQWAIAGRAGRGQHRHGGRLPALPRAR